MLSFLRRGVPNPSPFTRSLARSLDKPGEDSGLGLEQAQIDGLFNPFDRLGAECTAIEKQGLGLVIARSLARTMLGDIEVQSVPGVGSTFSVLLPLAPH